MAGKGKGEEAVELMSAAATELSEAEDWYHLGLMLVELHRNRLGVCGWVGGWVGGWVDVHVGTFECVCACVCVCERVCRVGNTIVRSRGLVWDGFD